MITKNEILKGQQVPADLEANLTALLEALNKFRLAYGKPMICTSGYRSFVHNIRVGGALKSAHRTCQAADFSDRSGELKKWALENLKLLEEWGLWMEDPDHTPTWLHLQTRPAKNRVFTP